MTDFYFLKQLNTYVVAHFCLSICLICNLFIDFGKNKTSLDNEQKDIDVVS